MRRRKQRRRCSATEFFRIILTLLNLIFAPNSHQQVTAYSIHMLEPWLPTILIIQEIISWYLVGFIWLVQLSIYPQLDLLLRHAPDIWHQTHQRHCGLMGFFAGGPMIVQLGTALICCYVFADAVSWTLVSLVVIT